LLYNALKLDYCEIMLYIDYTNDAYIIITDADVLIKHDQSTREWIELSGIKRFIEKLNSGQHTTKWDAKSASTGIYFVKMECGGFSGERKVVLVR
jgi:hypothetical protein